MHRRPIIVLDGPSIVVLRFRILNLQFGGIYHFFEELGHVDSRKLIGLQSRVHFLNGLLAGPIDKHLKAAGLVFVTI